MPRSCASSSKAAGIAALSDRLTELETRQDSLTAHLSDIPQDVPELHPGIAQPIGAGSSV
ncbi:hypothetical protein F4V89_27035 [Neorhizobium galegae]|nr:hypothetical protein F4V89_27035 [Neorhizobium galegae]